MSEHGSLTGAHNGDPGSALSVAEQFKLLLELTTEPSSTISFHREPAVLPAEESYGLVAATASGIDRRFQQAISVGRIYSVRNGASGNLGRIAVSSEDLLHPESAMVVSTNTLGLGEEPGGRLVKPSSLGMSFIFQLASGNFALTYGLSRARFHSRARADMVLTAKHSRVSEQGALYKEAVLAKVLGIDPASEEKMLRAVAESAGIALERTVEV